jgi:hypothetical protein
MTIRDRVVLAVSLVGAFALVGAIVAQTKKSRRVTITLIPSPQIIMVDNSAECVDADDKTAATDGTASDTVEWRIDPHSNNVTNFHIIFTKKSPSQGNERYFDKTRNKFTAIKHPKNDGEVFNYDISVDLADGSNRTCDPHLIVIKGSGDE